MKLMKCCGIRGVLDNYDGIDLLGFNFIKSSKRKITKDIAQSISKDIQDKGYKNIRKVGLFEKSHSLEDIRDIMRHAKLDSVQLYSDDREAYKQLKNMGYFIIKPIMYDNLEIIETYHKIADLLIIDGNRPGSGKYYDYKQVFDSNIEFPFLIAGGVSKDNVSEIFQLGKNREKFYGIDLASGIDNGTNIDPNKIREINNLIVK